MFLISNLIGVSCGHNFLQAKNLKNMNSAVVCTKD
eukprot:UN16116